MVLQRKGFYMFVSALAIYSFAIVFFAFAQSIGEDNETKLSVKQKNEYSKYTNNKWKFSFIYQKGWILEEGQLSEYPSDSLKLIVRGIMNEGTESYSSVTLLIVPAKNRGGSLSNLDEYMEDTLSKRRVGNADITSSVADEICDFEGRNIKISYINTPEGEESFGTRVIDTWVVILRNGYFYDLRYHESEEEFEAHRRMLRLIKNSFMFEKTN